MKGAIYRFMNFVENQNMKQFGLLFIIFSIIPLFASAHAGPFDRYLQQMVSSRALLVILLNPLVRIFTDAFWGQASFLSYKKAD